MLLQRTLPEQAPTAPPRPAAPQPSNPQDEFYSESARLLGEAAKRMEIDQEIANAMPTVANIGDAPHHHGAHRDHHAPGAAAGPSSAAIAALEAAEAEARQRREEERDSSAMALLPKIPPPRVEVSPRQTFILVRWAQKVAGALVGLGTAAFLLLYQWVVEPAPYHSLRARAWVALTQVGGGGGFVSRGLGVM